MINRLTMSCPGVLHITFQVNFFLTLLYGNPVYLLIIIHYIIAILKHSRRRWFRANRVKLCMVDQLVTHRLTLWPDGSLFSGSVPEVRGWLDLAFYLVISFNVTLLFFRWRYPERHPLVGLRGGWGT